uniref:ResB-like domain-containing protein n=1 Tax=Anaerolinea thermolimosa TaxID=229919 RepID=A0A7C4KIM4_9CHLR
MVRLYRNFRIDTEHEKPKPFDDPGEGENRAVEVLVKDADGKETTEYIFEKFEGHQHPGNEQRLTFRYVRMEKDYFSDIEIWDGETIVKKTVEVNHPIHYGGYYFYQYGWDPKEQKYTVLNVTSDSGIRVVFAGYIVLMAGLIWHLWAKPVLSKIQFKPEAVAKNGN